MPGKPTWEVADVSMLSAGSLMMVGPDATPVLLTVEEDVGICMVYEFANMFDQLVGRICSCTIEVIDVQPQAYIATTSNTERECHNVW